MGKGVDLLAIDPALDEILMILPEALTRFG